MWCLGLISHCQCTCFSFRCSYPYVLGGYALALPRLTVLCSSCVQHAAAFFTSHSGFGFRRLLVVPAKSASCAGYISHRTVSYINKICRTLQCRQGCCPTIPKSGRTHSSYCVRHSLFKTAGRRTRLDPFRWIGDICIWVVP